jgi:hypothetical protein
MDRKRKELLINIAIKEIVFVADDMVSFSTRCTYSFSLFKTSITGNSSSEWEQDHRRFNEDATQFNPALNGLLLQMIMYNCDSSIYYHI